MALVVEYYSELRFKDGLFQFMTAFSLPWYAIVGAQAALAAHLGYAAAVIIGIIATTAGRWIIDIACNVVPKQLVRGEFFVRRRRADRDRLRHMRPGLGLPVLASTAIAFVVGFGFRLLSQFLGWEEWEPWEPAGLDAGEKTRKTLGEGLQAELGQSAASERNAK